jgi:virulence-associated protein VapD
MPITGFPRAGTSQAEPTAYRRTSRVYAIAFDINTELAERVLGPNYRDCYRRIERVFAAHGFSRQQGSLFYGRPESDAVDCVMAVKDLDEQFPQFGRIVTDIQMLRVDEKSDLRKVLRTDFRFDAAAND